MRTPERPVWSEGMLLSPQHLQAHDRAHEALVAARVAAVAPIDWGVVELAFDEAALAAGEVRVVRFAGILPDGLPLAFDEPARAPAPRPAAGLLAPGAPSLDVLLAVPRERDGVASYSDAAEAGACRFVTHQRLVADAADPKASAEVRLARPNAHLLFGGERGDDHVAVKIAELRRGAAGGLELDPEYVPPCLRVGASPWLVERLRGVLDALIGSHQRLSAKRRHREAASEVTSLELTHVLQLLVLGEGIAELRHLADVTGANPRELHRVLGRLVGQLCSLAGPGRAVHPGSLPPFDHLDLRGAFAPLFATLRELLEDLPVDGFLSVPLETRPGGVHQAKIDGELAAAQLFLTVASDAVAEGSTAEQVPTRCKLSSSSQLVELMRGALPGLKLSLAVRPPAPLPVRAGAVFFELERGGPCWERIVAEKNLAFYLPPPFDPERTRVELFAVRAAAPHTTR